MPLFKGENRSIYGLHDPGGEHLMIVNGQAKGWVVVTEEIGSEANDRRSADYRTIADRGLGVIVRLNQSYGANGTIPREERYPEFAQRVANFVAGSQGAHIWIIGNEMNLEREQPRQRSGGQAEPITPRRYAECYKLCRQKIKALAGHSDDIVVVGAIGPWNGQTWYEADPKGAYPANKLPNAPSNYPYNGFFGDFIKYFQDMLLAIGPGNCDGIAIHAYSHGYEPQLITDTAKMGAPFQNYHYNFFTYRDQMNAIPEAMRHLPVYLTEANGDVQGKLESHQPGATWPFGNNGWIKAAYKEIDSWNRSGRQQIRCMVLFRWKKDPLGWSIDGKQGVQQDFTEAIAQNYQWDPDAGQPKPEPKPDPEPARPPYLAKYLSHDTPKQLSTGQTVTVNLKLQNAGSFQWVRGGDKPFRLGFQWYDANNQPVTLPPALDYRTALPRTIAPNGTVELEAQLRSPDQPGSYRLRWDMVHELVTWFSSQGDPGLVAAVTVAAAVPVTPPEEVEREPGSQPISVEAQDVTGSLPQHATKRYPMRTHADIKRIIIHHTATPANITVERIAQFQVQNRDLPGIVYHFCITAEGVVYQTQYLETVAIHAGPNSDDSVGVCLIGNFTNQPPPKAQLTATATLLAQLVGLLGLPNNAIIGYNEIIATQSPGATWPQWKPPLLADVERLLKSEKPPTAQPAEVDKPLDHYLLFWYRTPQSWGEWDLQGAFDYIARFKPVVGFDIQEAQQAKYVTIVGGKDGVPPNAERILRKAGCQVERIAGETESETRQLLSQMAAEGRRFDTLT
ncbi:MAG: N-acetylmuramoyl-L-alanine amidase [Anaerolineae bacterium]|nr:N-acetylmuramoyl-L-alanine amidase [Anaerolineae bacterium]